jgi:hypothetical protein
VGGIDEEDVPVPCLSGVEGRPELVVEELALDRDVLGPGLLGGTGMARDRCQWKPRSARKVRVWVKPRRMPVSSWRRSMASAVVRTGCSFSDRLMASAWAASSLVGRCRSHRLSGPFAKYV